MANHPSAKKRNRQRIRRTERNRAIKSATRTQLKHARHAIDTKSSEAATLVHDVESSLDKAARKRVIHPKAAARKKSRLARRLRAATKSA